MSFIETPRFPDIIALGSSGGAEYSTDVVIVNNGTEFRKQRRSTALHKYRIGIATKGSVEIDALRQFHHSMLGRLHGFRFKDFNDFRSSDFDTFAAFGDQSIGTGDGSTVAFQIRKQYTRGALTLNRTIKKIVSGTTLLGIGGVQAQRFTVDEDTGIITITADVAKTIDAAVSLGGSPQSTRFTLAGAAHGLVAGDTFFISGLTGGWTSLNDTRVTITAQAATTVDFNFDSSGLGAPDSPTGGSINTIPQLDSSSPPVGETVTAGYEFDVPVRFESDSLQVQQVSPGIETSSIGLVELLNP